MHSEDIVFLKNHYDKYSNSMLVPLSLEAYLSSNNFKLNNLIFDWAFVKGTSSSDFHNYSKKINVDYPSLESNSKTGLNISPPRAMKKNSYHQSFRMRKFICNFLFPRFFSDLCWI